MKHLKRFNEEVTADFQQDDFRVLVMTLTEW